MTSLAERVATAQPPGRGHPGYDPPAVPPDGQLTPAAATLAIEPNDPAPAYVQLQRRVRLAVAAGTLRPGDRLPSVRELARRLSISANTVGRAYAGLSREGVIIARAGHGSEIAGHDTLDRDALARVKRERLQTLARQVVVRGLAWGLEPSEIAAAVAQELARRKDTGKRRGAKAVQR